MMGFPLSILILNSVFRGKLMHVGVMQGVAVPRMVQPPQLVPRCRHLGCIESMSGRYTTLPLSGLYSHPRLCPPSQEESFI